MRVAVLTTGDEIMAGNIVDSNAAWISDKCWIIGHDVVMHMAVGDDEVAIGSALKAASEKADVVVVSGGLGATVDDITLDAAVKHFGLKMVYHEDIWEGIKDFFKRINRVCSENNKKQAYLPKGAKTLPNKVGTAPGVQLNHNGAEYFFVPGVPKEMRQIFDDSIFPWLKKHCQTPGYAQKFLKCFGLPEATFDQMLKGIDLGGVRLSFRVSFPEIKIKLVARTEDEAKSVKLVDKAAEKVREKLSDFIYGEDEETLEEVVGNILINKNYQLAVAESCTGGLIANRITNISGSSRYFDRGFITYSNRAKIGDIGVPEDVVNKHGAVSKEVAEAMAEGAIKASGADVALAVTGIAGPTGGTKEKPVGTVHIAIAGSTGAVHRQYIYPRDRIWFKEIVAATALDMLRRYLKGLDL